MNLILNKIVLVITLTLLLMSCSVRSESQIELDQELLQAVKDGSLEEFKDLLQSGANPNAIFGWKYDQWVMCAAAKHDNPEFMRLAIENSGDVNLRNFKEKNSSSLAGSFWSSPLLCAIQYNTADVFDLLIEKGVETDFVVCKECKPIKGIEKFDLGPRWNNSTPIRKAVGSRRYRMAYVMLEKKKTPLRKEVLHVVINSIEAPRGFDTNHPENVWRLKLAELLKERGIDVLPDRGIPRFKPSKYGEPRVF